MRVPIPKATTRRFAEYVKAQGGQQAVATLLGCSRSNVNLIVKGKRRPGKGTVLAQRVQSNAGIAPDDWYGLERGAN